MPGNRAVFEEALRKGHNHAWDKKWPQAIAEYQRAVAEIDDDPMAWLSFGTALLEGRRANEAKDAYRRASELRPNDIPIHQKLAELYEQLKDVENAMQMHFFVANAYAQSGETAKAIDAWRNIVRLNPTHAESRRQLAELLVKVQQPIEAAKEYMALSRNLQLLGRGSDAAEYARKALAHDSRNAEARAFLGSLQVVGVGSPRAEERPKPPPPPPREASATDDPISQTTQRALSRLAEAVFENPPNVATLISQAITYHAQKQSALALECYEQALREGANALEIHFCLGVLLHELVRDDEASQNLQKMLGRPEYMLGSFCALGQCSLSRGLYKEAIGHWLNAVKVLDLRSAERKQLKELNQQYESLIASHTLNANYETAQALQNSILSFLSGKNWEAKVADIRRQLDVLAGNGAPLTLLELLQTTTAEQVLLSLNASQELLKRDMLVAAIEECYHALSIAPSYVPLHVRLAELFTRQGRLEASVEKYTAIASLQRVRDERWQLIQTYRNILMLSPDDMETRTQLKQALIQQGDLAGAIDQYVEQGNAYQTQAQTENALTSFQEALKLIPRANAADRWSLNIWHQMGEIFMQRLAWQDAVNAYLQVRKLDARDSKAALRLVDLYFKQGRDNDAHVELTRLMGQADQGDDLVQVLIDLSASRPRDARLRRQLVDLFVRRGQMEQAIAELDALGELQLKANQVPEAIQTIEQIVSLNPPNAENYRELLTELRSSL